MSNCRTTFSSGKKSLARAHMRASKSNKRTITPCPTNSVMVDCATAHSTGRPRTSSPTAHGPRCFGRFRTALACRHKSALVTRQSTRALRSGWAFCSRAPGASDCSLCFERKTGKSRHFFFRAHRRPGTKGIRGVWHWPRGLRRTRNPTGPRPSEAKEARYANRKWPGSIARARRNPARPHQGRYPPQRRSARQCRPQNPKQGAGSRPVTKKAAGKTTTMLIKVAELATPARREPCACAAHFRACGLRLAARACGLRRAQRAAGNQTPRRITGLVFLLVFWALAGACQRHGVGGFV